LLWVGRTQAEDQGVAKIGLTAYDAKSGEIAPYSPAEPTFGYATRQRWVILSLFEWMDSDALPASAVEERSRSGRAAH
jgi:hypothetical protein